MVRKWIFSLVATLFVAQAYSAAVEINLNQLLAEEALKYPGAMDMPDEELMERSAVISPRKAQEVNINQMLADEAMKYPEAFEDPDEELIERAAPFASRAAKEVNLNQLLAEEAMKYPEAFETPDESLIERTAARTAQEVNINKMLAEEAIKYPEAFEVPDELDIMSRAGACQIGTNNGDLGSKQPILLQSGTTKIVLPSTAGFINIDNGKTIDMHCTSSFAAPLSGKKISAKCDGGNIFEANGNKLSIENIVCTSAVAHTVRQTTRTCYDGSAILEVGFALDVGFITTIEVCHSLSKQVTYYTHYSISPANVAFQKSVARPSFITGGFYNGADVNQLYTQVQQMATIEKTLGAGSQKYFDLSKNVYLARGHMAAKADYIYAPEQMATFYFVNAAPQWQPFNAGNWERVEDGTKKFAQTRNSEFDVYTGTWGVSTLPDDRGIQKELYLSYNAAGQGLIPVPKLYYRVIIEKSSRLGIVLIGVNNPHVTLAEIQKDYIICNDVSSKVNFVNWEKTNILKGYSYACEVPEFAKKIGQLPSLSVSGLLY